MSEIDALFGKAGEPVPAVHVADMKVMWAYLQELNARHPGGGVGVEVGIWQRICSPGADIRAVSYRCQMLSLLEILLRAAWPGGELSENALKVAARMDLRWMAPGVVQNGFPFSVDGFLEEVMRESVQPSVPQPPAHLAEE
jgi:hypothetical protein